MLFFSYIIHYSTCCDAALFIVHFDSPLQAVHRMQSECAQTKYDQTSTTTWAEMKLNFFDHRSAPLRERVRAEYVWWARLWPSFRWFRNQNPSPALNSITGSSRDGFCNGNWVEWRIFWEMEGFLSRKKPEKKMKRLKKILIGSVTKAF